VCSVASRDEKSVSLFQQFARGYGTSPGGSSQFTLTIPVGSYVTRLLRLSFLAPDIVAAILKGEQPAELTASRLAQWKNLPLDWTEQRKVLGFT
jgi:hypothetical protein